MKVAMDESLDVAETRRKPTPDPERFQPPNPDPAPSPGIPDVINEDGEPLPIENLSDSESSSVESSWETLDFRWCLFLSALRSFRWPTTLKPMPPHLRDFLPLDGVAAGEEIAGEDHEKITRLCDSVRHSHLRRGGNFAPSFVFPSSPTVSLPSLFAWVSASSSSSSSVSSSFSLTLLPDVERTFREICDRVGQNVVDQVPSYVFRVTYPANSPLSRKFESLLRSQQFPSESQGNDVVSAFHGSSLENFYSILHFGLSGHMTKRSVFGEGVYLAGDLAVALHFSSSGATWRHTRLGSSLRVVAVCDVINRRRLVDAERRRRDGAGVAGVFRGVGSNAVPFKYFVVKNSDAIKLKFLLVFASSRCDDASLSPTIASLRVRMRVAHWLRRYGLLAFCGFYLLFLCIIGMKDNIFTTMAKFFKL